ncbi:jg23531, partial [Pararge aegeria aegeria]
MKAIKTFILTLKSCQGQEELAALDCTGCLIGKVHHVQIVVIFVLWMILLLIVYYLFLRLLVTFSKKQQNRYNEVRSNSFE